MFTKQQILGASKKEAQLMIKANIVESWEVAAWAVKIVFYNQTQDEQISKETRYNNSIGFSGPDAKTLSYWAKIIIASGPNAIYSPAVRKLISNRISKYSGQILRHIEKVAIR
jgi:hypothetical protein